MAFDLLRRMQRLSPQNITIREQARLEENPLDLRWPALAPRLQANSLKIRDLTKATLRLTAEYRAWNANGRELWEAVGPQSEWEILPLTATKHLDERRMLELSLPDPAIRSLIDNGVVADVGRWSTLLADAVHRRIEAAFFEGWLSNTFSMRDPVSGTALAGPLGFSASRYVAAGVAWTGGSGGTAYNNFVTQVQNAARFLGGQPSVARMRDATFQLIVSSAPAGPNAQRPTVTNVNERLAEQGIRTAIVVDERTYDKSTDGGQGTATTFFVPTGKIGFQPPDGRIGNTHSVAASRGGKELVTNAKVNLQDVTIWYSELNRGMTLLMEAENIAVPMPEEQRLYVYDALV
ncbi:MAG: hypothetical protein ABIQ32_01145 [Sphingomicrobium sp.]